ncbi:uncharacterized protein LOC134244987 [Saccostrea cucullata]|uniref:uncharacterized protein LOC134244987 n=1 Tax=Saccostrea cuccullata TaxID=36930 RepID=UPI002ED6408C
MASSLLTTDDKNYIYLNIATLEEIPRIFRILLESQIQPHNLPAAVQSCATLKLGKEQSDKAIPTPPNVPNYEKFDVTLLYTLLRNLCPAFKPSEGWGSEPSNNELCLGDDIERLRIFRNNSFAHLKKPCIPDSDFKTQWTSLENICQRMEKNMKKYSCRTPYLNGLNDILKRELGGDCLLYYQFLLEIRNQITELSEEFKAVLEICGPTEVWYGTDAEMEIASECESNNIIYWRKKVGAIVHEINRTTEKYQGSSNKKLIIRRVTREDEGGYQAIMQTKSCQKYIHSNQIDLKVLGNIPCVILSGAESVCFGNLSEISAAIKSDLPILEMNWGKLVDDQFVDFDVHIPKYKGSFLEDQTSKLVINDANFEDESIYCLAVRNVVGEGWSNPFVFE